MTHMTYEKPVTLSQAVAKGLAPCSTRSLRRMIASGRLNATNVSCGTQPRWTVHPSDLRAAFKKR